MLKIGVLVSGGGTNLQAIIDRIEDGTIKNTEIVMVISNNKNAKALQRAERHHIPSMCISPKDFESRAVFNQTLLKTLMDLNVDLIVLPGFIVVIPPEICGNKKRRHTGNFTAPDYGTGGMADYAESN